MANDLAEEYKAHQEMLKDHRKGILTKLKECKDEWLERNAKNQPALGVSTVQQILDNATGGLWDFRIEEQWREEVMKYDKGSRQWSFDGYVYHVRGAIHIEGLGSRTQYGSKVAIGGKDNQNSSYKAAASDCLKKAASLFGVGASIYSKIKVEEEEYTQIQQDPNYAVGQQQQYQQPQQQQAQQEPYVNEQGLYQSGEYVYVNEAWVHLSQYQPAPQAAQPTNAGQYPSPGMTESQQWHHDTMQQNDPQGYQRMMQEQQQKTPEQIQQEQFSAEMDKTIQEVNAEVAQGKTELPFEGAPAAFEAQPQAQAQKQDFEAVQYTAPVEAGQPAPPEMKKEIDPLEHIDANNPWNTPENQSNILQFQQHKERLGIGKDADLLPYIRDFFKDEKASITTITPETLAGFNTHLQNIAV